MISFFSYFFCSSQMKLNKSKEIDILINTPWKFGKTNEVIYTIENKSNRTYIIDPFGFYGESYVLENGKVLKPTTYLKNGYYSRNDKLCHEDLIILKPFQKLHHSINYDKNNRALYTYTKPNKYEEIIKSSHNRYNATILGCDNFIKELESKGYKVLEDSIVAKIPLRH